MTPRPKVAAILQARMGSSRLPGKVLRPLMGRPMLERQIERVKRAKRVDQIVVATTSDPRDRPIFDLAQALGVGAFAGSEEDVLDRFYRAARQYDADVVVRLTADCPLIDPAVIDLCVERLHAQRDEVDYVGVGPTFAEGLDVEAMPFSVLERAWQEASRAYEREHVTVYVWQSGRFRVLRLVHSPDLSSMRWTVDEERDFQFVTAVYEALFPRYGYAFGVAEILALLAERPDLLKINQGITRNEGFLKSLRVERQGQRGLGVKRETLTRQQHAHAAPVLGVGCPPEWPPLVRAKGSHVWDADGNEYVDYTMARGAAVLGYDDPITQAALAEQVQAGSVFPCLPPTAFEVRKMLQTMIPCAENVCFAQSGAASVSAAIRAARRFTGREGVARVALDGEEPSHLQFVFNRLDSLRAIFAQHPGEIAAVILEPCAAEPPASGFLPGVSELTREHGAVLIFDETLNGFRFHLGGSHQRFGVDPDLACFGESLANGLPLGAVTGRAEIMQVLPSESSSAGVSALSLAAAKSALTEFREKQVAGHLWELGWHLQAAFNRLVSDYGLQKRVECRGLPPRLEVVFQSGEEFSSEIARDFFRRDSLRRGVLAIGGAHYVSFAHTVEDIEDTLGIYQESLDHLSELFRRGKTGQSDSRRLPAA